jgi:ribosomal protein L11 methyltransferase
MGDYLPLFELRISLPAGPSRDRLADLLWEELGAAWVSANSVGLVAGFAEEGPARAASIVVAGDLVVLDEKDLSYLDGWRAWARPAMAGRLLVRPPWVPLTAEPSTSGLTEVVIDPGHAFGHGGHPSTRLMLEALSERLRPGQSVLDVGCGSGVLSVAACVLGAGSVTALDIDPVALAATSSNAAANGVADRLSVTGSPVTSVQGCYDVVLANIGASVLRELAPALAERVADGGWLALSGLLEDQWAEVAGMVVGELEEVLHEEGWATVVLRPAPGAPK